MTRQGGGQAAGGELEAVEGGRRRWELEAGDGAAGDESEAGRWAAARARRAPGEGAEWIRWRRGGRKGRGKEKEEEKKSKEKKKKKKGQFRYFTISPQLVELFCQTFSKMTLALPEKPLH